ncbi:MAG: Rpn family recombination-promoting nuclease/putative transposase, partial [Candidatus Rhabdochlamydia sp.]
EKVIGKDHIINKAYTTLNKYYWTKKELMSYDKVKRARMDHQAILQYKFDEGEAKGIKKGIEKGIEQGIEKGKVEVAKRLLQDGFKIDMIIRSTGLSKEQVEELKKYVLEENIVVNF